MNIDLEKPSRIRFTKGPLLIVIAALLWGLDGVLRRSLYSLPPINIIFSEHLFGFCVIAPFAWESFRVSKIKKRDWLTIGLVSLLSGVIGTLFFTTALLSTQFISFSVVYLLQKLQPIFAISTARIFLKEKLHKDFYLWAILALVSAYFVTFPNGIINFKTGSGTMVASMFAIGAAFAWGSSTTFSKIALKDLEPALTTALRFFFTSIIAFFGVIIFGKLSATVSLSPTQSLTLIAIALSTGMVALLIYYKGLRNTPVSVSTILELFYPLIAVAIDVAVYHNTLFTSQYLASILLLYSMYRVSKLTENN